MLHPIGKLRIGANILDMDGSSLNGGATRGTLATEPNGICFHECSERRRYIVGGHTVQKLPVVAENEGMFGLAQPDCVLGKGFENRLQIECGPANNLQELAGRGLLFKGNPQLRIPCLHLLEQPRVLDSYYRLSSERLHELDLLVAKRLGSAPVHRNDADGYAITQEGHGQYRTTSAGA